ncbi:alpha-2-macroglobulin [Cellulophaga sp. HaHaR_3_176]|uniref:alpha-2-macroglobulin family protein n=1 Tax=Cellulophaga sp. HaHaR_3_176 TaxID=1942464 RepID=UPI001C1FA615|nr:MG2 domain-containing protein [Cellulophaga sp. HaHaR_3_176]QWX82961.1 alpha-2-macroglobulin [Cellulophaga sp. HaHaR_3_176]
MKKATLVLSLILFSQFMNAQDDKEVYSDLWAQVQKLENESLTKSALKIVSSIADKAKKENNSPQIVKALLYSSKYALTLEENAQLKIIEDFKAEISKAEFPTKNVLDSYLANLYWKFFQQHSYQFYNRTKTEEKVDETDFRTWDLTTIFNEISIHFNASLENTTELQKVKISDFDVILNQYTNSEKHRPTLFDVLAHTALSFYKTNENSITRPADKFEINNTEMLCEGYEFTKQNIDTTDKTSLQSKALEIYKELLKFHANDVDIEAYTVIDIERLNFINDNATFSNKEIHFVEILKNSAERIKKDENAALYLYEIAQKYQHWGNTYVPKTNEEHRWKHKEALEICESVFNLYPNSIGAKKCINLKAGILGQRVTITNEKYVPINKPSRLLVNYKNLDNLNFSVYKSSPNELKKLEDIYDDEKEIEFIKKLKVAKTWNANLKDEKDYQLHTIEVLVPELENGFYIIVATSSEATENSYEYSSFQVTNTVLVESQDSETHTFQAIDRTTGKPLADAKIQLKYKINYDKKFFTKTFITTEKGFVEIKKIDKSWTDVSAKIAYNGDTAFYGDYYINTNYSRNENNYTNYSSFLFTDRSIYRPGQPLYFKGIAIAESNEETRVKAQTNVTVSLLDANYQVVKKLDFKTNEYGSYTGEFIIPNTGLTGAYQLQVSSNEINLNGRTSFSVEEYKRPKFEASFTPVTETYKVNDIITVVGQAKAYAGSLITDAKVTYKVSRIVHYPRWYYWYRPYFNSTPQEITNGETVTDSSGNFKLDFKAIPDTNTSPENLPTFSYEVTADITDVNGETHSTSTIVNVGYHSLTASISIPTKIDKYANDNKISIHTSNLNGQFVASKGTLKIYKLKAPTSVLRNRPWVAPDYDSFGKDKFKELFPNEAYANEDDSSKWDKGKLAYETAFDTGKEKEFSLPNLKKWLSGNYIVEIETKDKFGQTVQDKAETALFSEKDKSLADNQLFDVTTDKSSYKIGDEAKVKFSSAAKDLTITVSIEKNHEIIDTKIIHLSNNSKTITLPVQESDLGGFVLTYSFSAYNSFNYGSVAVSVPYPTTDLEIETVTFRDKLQPGTDETWTFKIKGAKGEKVAAELLASMYDASLDAFKGHSWYFNPLYKQLYYSSRYSNANNCFGTTNFSNYLRFDSTTVSVYQNYDSFNWFNFNFDNYRVSRTRKMYKKTGVMSVESMEMEDSAEVSMELEAPMALASSSSEMKKEKDSLTNKPEEKSTEPSFDTITIRKNLQENAFFFPQLLTDKEGSVSFNFTTPEALTKWKLQLLAHTKNAESATTTLQTVTQKELMVTPNAPRFLREGDKIIISTKIANLTDKVLKGQAKLVLTDAVTGIDITSKLTNVIQKEFSVDSVGNTQVSWSLTIPENLQAVQYKVLAKAGDFSDGEQNVLPVLTNRMLVTESLPMWVRSNQTKTFSLDKLKNNNSTTLSNHKLTLEITSNPAWYAVQALPYLMEYPYECNEQTFSRYYANALASHIATSNPRIQEVFDQWANSDALLSNLEKNEELKLLIIQETPWLRDAQSETEQKKRIALLFNMNKMKSEQATALRKLEQNQMSSGAWSWFAGGRENRYITQHIVTGLGHLNKLTSSSESGLESSQKKMINNAISYLDNAFVAEYNYMKKHTKNINNDHLSYTQIHYLYMRSFYKDVKTSKKVNTITDYYKGQIQKYWKSRNLYSKGMLALIMNRMDDAKTAEKIIHALEENSITNDELGMYWKENTNSWYWYQAPIETQSLLIEAFSEIQNDVETVDNLKIWLLKNKQTNQWKTTKATTEAVYALLLQGSDWLSLTDAVTVLVGGEKIDSTKLEDVRAEAGTGYYKTSWDTKEITPKMADVQISKKGNGIAWGAMYWQYFEDLDKITSAETPLKLKKKLFLKKNTNTGEELAEITEKTVLKVGDLVRVRIELRADRDMEFVHMKDMRAAGFEPINVISSYKWQDGLGYYESTKDASTNFFFDYLSKGVYVFEYDLRVNNAGDFSNGITTIQSMYAPEFSSHSEGVRVTIE